MLELSLATSLISSPLLDNYNSLVFSAAASIPKAISWALLISTTFQKVVTSV